MFAWFFDLVGLGLAVLLAYGALILAPFAFASRFSGRVPALLSEALVIVLVVVSAWNFSAIEHDQAADLRSLRAELDDARRRHAEDLKNARRAQALALERMRFAAADRETVDEYQRARAAGDALPCPYDDAYRRAMRRIRVGVGNSP